ncbi:MAG: methyltransferase domain-containing protein [Myxococcota bacterium]
MSDDSRVIPFYGAINREMFAIERRAMDRDGVVLRWLDETLPGGWVLDIGAGDGTTAQALTREGRTVVPLEPAAGMVRDTSDRPSLVWVKGVAQELPFHDGTFDAVYATWAFFFSNRDDLDVGLAEARRVLKPGGRIVLVDNAGDDDLTALSPRPITSDSTVFSERGFSVTVIETGFRFDSEAEGRTLLGFWFGEEAAARFTGTVLDYRVFGFVWDKPARPLIVAHGLEGSPEGAKVRAYRAAGFAVYAPDGRKQSLAVRVGQIRELVQAHPGAVLVGSSYGGLAAAALVDELGEDHGLHALVLLAPALHWQEPPVADPATLQIPSSLPCTVFHGQRDTIVSIEVSRALAERCPHVQLVVTDDEHRLIETLPHVVRHLIEVTR